MNKGLHDLTRLFENGFTPQELMVRPRLLEFASRIGWEYGEKRTMTKMQVLLNGNKTVLTYWS